MDPHAWYLMLMFGAMSGVNPVSNPELPASSGVRWQTIGAAHGIMSLLASATAGAPIHDAETGEVILPAVDVKLITEGDLSYANAFRSHANELTKELEKTDLSKLLPVLREHYGDHLCDMLCEYINLLA